MQEREDCVYVRPEADGQQEVRGWENVCVSPSSCPAGDDDMAGTGVSQADRQSFLCPLCLHPNQDLEQKLIAS